MKRRPPWRWLVRGLLWVGAVGLIALPGSRSPAFTFFTYGGAVVTWPGAHSLRFLSPSTFPQGSVPEQLILEAMGLWNLVPGSDFLYSYSRLDQDYPIDNFDGYNDTAAVPASLLDPGVLGVTFLVNNGSDWYDMDIVFADVPVGVGYTFDPNPDCHIVDNPMPVNGFSFLLVAVHELGHAIGLGHDPVGDESPGAPWFVATMNPRYPSGGTLGQENIVELHADDRNGARYLYPHSGPSGPPYVDVALSGYAAGAVLGRAEPLTFAPAGAYPGESVTARSVIENLGSTHEFSVRQGFYLSADAHINVGDQLLGFLSWDLAMGDAFQFDVEIPLPVDFAAGDYYLGAIIDDLNQIAERYEDNNAASYCQPLTILKRAPQINPLAQQNIACSASFTGPTPTLTLPLNMSPVTWSLDAPPAGMTIHPATGVISWPQPVHSPFPYFVTLRATNTAGSGTQTLILGVLADAPVIAPLADVNVSCAPAFVGPTPAVTSPGCMWPVIQWSLDAAPPGVTINSATGVISWPNPEPAPTPYNVTLRAFNAVGSGTRTFGLHVTAGDFTGDGAVGMTDAAAWVDCLTGPLAPLAPGCSCGDTDGDGDFDLRDVRFLINAFAP